MSQLLSTSLDAVAAPELPQDLRGCISVRDTPVRTVAATMRCVAAELNPTPELTNEALLSEELDVLDQFCNEPAPVRDLLIGGALSPRGFMVMMVNTLVRVLPTYSEIPINLAAHGLQGDLRNYGLIALNVNDEAGGGDPALTHPALFNCTAKALSKIFDVPALSVRIGLGALMLRSTGDGDSADHRDAQFRLICSILLQDEFGRRLSQDELQADLEVARTYARLIAPEALACYRWRMQTLGRLLASQFQDGPSQRDYLELLSLLAMREAAAADPQNIFHSLSTMVLRYGGYLGDDADALEDALSWSDVHIDEELGNEAGYDGHSVEDDHAEQALGAVLDHVYGPEDFLIALRAMNAVNGSLRDLWVGTLDLVSQQTDEVLDPREVDPAIHERVRARRLQGLAP